MAVVTIKSTQITNRDATPSVLSNSRITKGQLTHARGVCAVGNGDSIGSKYLFCSIPSNAVPVSVRVTNNSGGTVGAGDIGLYKDTANGGAVVDADFFASALSLVSALTKAEQVYESGVITTANSEKPLWELLGLSSDPGLVYDVAMTLTAATDAAHTVMVEVDYTA